MGDIIPHSFGNRINWENDTDPIVREVRFLTHSPSEWHRTLLEAAQQFHWTREQVRNELQGIRIDLAQKAGIPGSDADIHRQWIESKDYFNPETFEFQEASPAETNAAVRPITQDIHDQVSTTLDAPPKADVIPFPGTTSSGFGAAPPPSSPLA